MGWGLWEGQGWGQGGSRPVFGIKMGKSEVKRGGVRLKGAWSKGRGCGLKGCGLWEGLGGVRAVPALYLGLKWESQGLKGVGDCKRGCGLKEGGVVLRGGVWHGCGPVGRA